MKTTRTTILSPDEANGITLQEFLLEEFVSRYGRRNWGLSQYTKNIAMLNNYVIPYIGELPLSCITSKHMDNYFLALNSVKQVRSKYRPRDAYVTRRQILDIYLLLQCAFRCAIEWDLLAKNPLLRSNKPRRETKKRTCLDVKTAIRMIHDCKDPRLYIILCIAFEITRLGEICGLRWSRIDLDMEHDFQDPKLRIDAELQRIAVKALEDLKDIRRDDILMVFPEQREDSKTRLVLETPKTASSIRVISIPPGLARALYQYKLVQEEERKAYEMTGQRYIDYDLVIAHPCGRPMEPRYVLGLFNKLYIDQKLNGSPVTFHSLRHTATTYHLRLTNFDIKTVQHNGGWSSADVPTNVYAESFEEDRKNASMLHEKAFYQSRTTKDMEPDDEVCCHEVKQQPENDQKDQAELEDEDPTQPA